MRLDAWDASLDLKMGVGDCDSFAEWHCERYGATVRLLPFTMLGAE